MEEPVGEIGCMYQRFSNLYREGLGFLLCQPLCYSCHAFIIPLFNSGILSFLYYVAKVSHMPKSDNICFYPNKLLEC